MKIHKILTELNHFYSIREISELSDVSEKTLRRINKGGDYSKSTYEKIFKAFNTHALNLSDEMTIPEMMNLSDNRYVVDSPDGWVEITDYIIKDVQPCRTISTGECSVSCSDLHRVQMCNGEWVYAKDIKIGDVLLVKCGDGVVKNIVKIEDQLVYDITVNSNNHRYWAGGISNHNSAKSFFVLQILANAQKKGMIPVIFDTEGAIDPETAAKFGLDTSQVKYVGCETIEQTRNAIYKFLKMVREKQQFGKFIIAIDSIANLNSEMELKRMEKDSASADMGTFAKAIKSLLKTCTNMGTLTKTPIIITNHVYDDPSAMYPSLEKNMPGGKTVVYLPSVTVQLARKLVKDGELKQVSDKLSASQKNYSGVVIRALTVKNRFAKQYIEGEMYLSFSKGLNKYYGLVEIMKGMGVISNSGSSYVDWEGNKLGYLKVWSKDIDLWENRLLPELEKRIKIHWDYGSSPEDDDLVALEEDDSED
jgi:RecA/RadA recombinase